jgi:hypothetical protein
VIAMPLVFPYGRGFFILINQQKSQPHKHATGLVHKAAKKS